MKANPKKLEGNDRIYGWEFGCDGFESATKSAKRLDLSVQYFCELLRELEDTAVKRPTDRTWPLRAGKPEVVGQRSTAAWRVCIRSVIEYAKRRQPVEV